MSKKREFDYANRIKSNHPNNTSNAANIYKTRANNVKYNIISYKKTTLSHDNYKINLCSLIKNNNFPISLLSNKSLGNYNFSIYTKKYFSLIAEDLITKSNIDNDTITKLSFLEYFQFPILLSEKLYLYLFESKEYINKEEFISQFMRIIRIDIIQLCFEVLNSSNSNSTVTKGFNTKDIRLIIRNFSDYFINTNKNKKLFFLLDRNIKLTDLEAITSNTNTIGSTDDNYFTYMEFKKFVCDVNSDILLLFIYFYCNIFFAYDSLLNMPDSSCLNSTEILKKAKKRSSMNFNNNTKSYKSNSIKSNCMENEYNSLFLIAYSYLLRVKNEYIYDTEARNTSDIYSNCIKQNLMSTINSTKNNFLKQDHTDYLVNAKENSKLSTSKDLKEQINNDKHNKDNDINTNSDANTNSNTNTLNFNTAKTLSPETILSQRNDNTKINNKIKRDPKDINEISELDINTQTTVDNINKSSNNNNTNKIKIINFTNINYKNINNSYLIEKTYLSPVSPRFSTKDDKKLNLLISPRHYNNYYHCSNNKVKKRLFINTHMVNTNRNSNIKDKDKPVKLVNNSSLNKITCVNISINRKNSTVSNIPKNIINESSRKSSSMIKIKQIQPHQSNINNTNMANVANFTITKNIKKNDLTNYSKYLNLNNRKINKQDNNDSYSNNRLSHIHNENNNYREVNNIINEINNFKDASNTSKSNYIKYTNNASYYNMNNSNIMHSIRNNNCYHSPCLSQSLSPIKSFKSTKSELKQNVISSSSNKKKLLVVTNNSGKFILGNSNKNFSNSCNHSKNNQLNSYADIYKQGVLLGNGMKEKSNTNNFDNNNIENNLSLNDQIPAISNKSVDNDDDKDLNEDKLKSHDISNIIDNCLNNTRYSRIFLRHNKNYAACFDDKNNKENSMNCNANDNNKYENVVTFNNNNNNNNSCNYDNKTIDYTINTPIIKNFNNKNPDTTDIINNNTIDMENSSSKSNTIIINKFESLSTKCFITLNPKSSSTTQTTKNTNLNDSSTDFTHVNNDKENEKILLSGNLYIKNKHNYNEVIKHNASLYSDYILLKNTEKCGNNNTKIISLINVYIKKEVGSLINSQYYESFSLYHNYNKQVYYYCIADNSTSTNNNNYSNWFTYISNIIENRLCSNLKINDYKIEEFLVKVNSVQCIKLVYLLIIIRIIE